MHVSTLRLRQLDELQAPSLRSARRPTPFVKWVGGKGRLLSQLRSFLPSDIKQKPYIEPFVGGGALFFAQQPKHALISDINSDLISTYILVRDDVNRVIQCLRQLAKKHSSKHYYKVRDRYNHRRVQPHQRAAMFIYLNKTCYNGLHRVNLHGQFNVPLGSYASPNILDEEGLRLASAVLQGTTIQCKSFDKVLYQAKAGDFIYLDPPYEPRSSTSNFTQYVSRGFSQKDQYHLYDWFECLHNKGCQLMLSNSDVPVIRKLYQKWRISSVQASRAINSVGSKRGPISELVICNY